MFVFFTFENQFEVTRLVIVTKGRLMVVLEILIALVSLFLTSHHRLEDFMESLKYTSLLRQTTVFIFRPHHVPILRFGLMSANVWVMYYKDNLLHIQLAIRFSTS